MCEKKLLKIDEFRWNPLYPNNIKSNGLEGFYSIIETGDKTARKYTILFQKPIDEDGFTLTKEEPELYILMEENYGDVKGGIRVPNPITEMGVFDNQTKNTFDSYSVNSYGSFHRAYRTLEEAKKGAYRCYYMVFSYAMSYIESRMDK